MRAPFHGGPLLAASYTPETYRFPDSRRLLTGVRDRAASVQALVSARTWPGAELQTLTTFLRTVVLRQLHEQTAHWYTDPAAESLATVRADEDLLSALTERLEGAEPASCPLPQLGRLVEELPRVVEHSLIRQQTP